MSFLASDRKGKNFLNITDNNGVTLKPFYQKSSAWLPHFGLSNSTCTRMTHLITNHAPLVTTKEDSSSKKKTYARTVQDVLKLDPTFFMSAPDTMRLGGPWTTPSSAYSCSSSKILRPSASTSPSYCAIILI